MTDPFDVPPAVGEAATLTGFLDRQRALLAWRVEGLDAAGLGTKVAASAVTLGGLLKHLAFVEDFWCALVLHGRPPAPPFDTWDHEAAPDWPWTSAAGDAPERLHALWQAATERSRAAVDEALARDGLDTLATWTFPGEPAASLRWILVHLIEEYARHVGHADLIREAIDGQVGEDPPRGPHTP